MIDDEMHHDLTEDERHLLASVDDLLADDATWSEPPVDLGATVVAAIRREREALAGSVPVAATVGQSGSGAPRSRRWRSSALGVLAGAAAATLVAVAITNRDDSPATAGPAATMQIAGTELAPAAQGTATATPLRSGTRIELNVPGLPRREGDQFYEMWVKNCGENHLVPAGTFHDLTDVVGWVGVSMQDYPIITVTREVVAGPHDALQGSSGEVVVTGRLAPCPAP